MYPPDFKGFKLTPLESGIFQSFCFGFFPLDLSLGINFFPFYFLQVAFESLEVASEIFRAMLTGVKSVCI